MEKKYLLFADFYVSVFNLGVAQPYEMLARIFNGVKSVLSEKDFDTIIALSKSDSTSLLAVVEVELKAKEVIDNAVAAILKCGYNPTFCSLSANIYYRVVTVGDENCMDILPATKRLNEYFHLKMKSVSNGPAKN